jgi:S-methylmethionine-dependent homocysteine/selenocysteine methylase
VTGQEFAAWLAHRPRVLDGATVSELLRQGVQAAGQLWGVGAILQAPEALRKLHAAYAAAGAEILTAATFRVAPYSLARAGLEARAGELARRAVTLAREAAHSFTPPPLVAASWTTLEDCYRPDLVPPPATLLAQHTATAQVLAAADPDLLLLETFNTAQEARIAAQAATATGLPVVVAFACSSDGRLLSGEDAAAAAAEVTLPGVVAVGVNCTRMTDLLPALLRMASATSLPLVAYANNAWFAEDSPHLAAAAVAPERYARCALAWLAAGARLVGGCCGTTPAHIAAVAAALSTHSG